MTWNFLLIYFSTFLTPKEEVISISGFLLILLCSDMQNCILSNCLPKFINWLTDLKLCILVIATMVGRLNPMMEKGFNSNIVSVGQLANISYYMDQE